MGRELEPTGAEPEAVPSRWGEPGAAAGVAAAAGAAEVPPVKVALSAIVGSTLFFSLCRASSHLPNIDWA